MIAFLKEIFHHANLRRTKILKYAAEGNLAELLNTKQIKFDLLNDIIENFARLFEKQNCLKKSNFKPKNLMKIIEIAIKNKALKEDPVLKGRHCLKGKDYLPMFKGNRLHLLQLTHQQLIGEGGLSRVLKVRNAITRTERALKIGIPDPRDDSSLERLYEIAKESTENEFNILPILHAGFPGGKYVPGIQRPYYAKTVIMQDGYETGVLSTKVFDNDLSKFTLNLNSPFITLDRKLDAYYEFLKGYEYCFVKKGFGHGDIKPENILCKDDKLFLADFGDGRILGEEIFYGATSADYFPITDRLNLHKPGITAKEFNTAFILKDVYGLGAAFFYLLSDGKRPYTLNKYDPEKGPYDENNQTMYTPKGNLPKQAPFNEKALQEEGIPEEIIKIVKGMTKLNPKKRTGLHDAIKQFDAYRAKRGQPILNFIK